MFPWMLIATVLASAAIPMPSDNTADVGGIKKVPYSEFHSTLAAGMVKPRGSRRWRVMGGLPAPRESSPRLSWAGWCWEAVISHSTHAIAGVRGQIRPRRRMPVPTAGHGWEGGDWRQNFQDAGAPRTHPIPLHQSSALVREGSALSIFRASSVR